MSGKLHPHVRRIIERVKAAGGSVDAAEDFGDLVRLNDLAGKLESPAVSDKITALLAPVHVGRLALHPLSMAAEEWLADHTDWFNTPRLDLGAVAWCMAHPGRDFMALTSRAAAVARVRFWLATLVGVSRAALEAAVAELLARGRDAEPARKEGEDSAGLGPILGLLCREYGQTPEYWLFDVPAALAKELIDADLIPRAAAQSRAWRQGGKKVTAPDPNSYEARAFFRFQQAAKEWVKRKTEGGGQRLEINGGEKTHAASPVVSSARVPREDAPRAPT